VIKATYFWLALNVELNVAWNSVKEKPWDEITDD
jgi:hypothetical protein